MVTASHMLIPSKVPILSLAVTRTGPFEWFVCQNVNPLKEINNSNTDDLHSLSERPEESLPIITVAWKDILHSGSLWPFPPPHYLFHQEDNYSVESQIFFLSRGKYRCALRLPPSSSLHSALTLQLLCLCLSPPPINHKLQSPVRWGGAAVCLGPGWVWLVIGCWSLLIRYGVWLRSLIRGCCSQWENGLSITTRASLARAKWDGGKGWGGGNLKWW